MDAKKGGRGETKLLLGFLAVIGLASLIVEAHWLVVSLLVAIVVGCWFFQPRKATS